jgi:hypothetical protein
MPRGGARVGSGRKRKERGAEWLAGHPGKRGPKLVERPASETDGPVTRPEDLEPGVKDVWDELAVFGRELGTLTPATAQAFADLCAYIVMERQMRASFKTVGGPDHRGMMARIEVARARFRLTPDGKPVVQVEQPKDEWAEFDGPKLVGKGA